jgi:hypothetical protein
MLDGIEANLADVRVDAVEKEHLRQRAELIRWLLNWDQTRRLSRTALTFR